MFIVEGGGKGRGSARVGASLTCLKWLYINILRKFGYEKETFIDFLARNTTKVIEMETDFLATL